MGQMLPHLHFDLGDILWFVGWVPTSSGAMVGACIGLFLLAMCERWISALRAVMEIHWRSRFVFVYSSMTLQSYNHTMPYRAEVARVNKHNTIPSTATPTKKSLWGPLADAPPFIPAYDLTRGVLQLGQSGLAYLMMLAVMCALSLVISRYPVCLLHRRTFQVGFLLSIVIGLGVGETLFGRYINPEAYLI